MVNWSSLYGWTKNNCSKKKIEKFYWGNTNCCYASVSFFNRNSSVIFWLINPKFLVFSISPVISYGKQIYKILLKLKFPFEIRKISFIFKSTRLKQEEFEDTKGAISIALISWHCRQSFWTDQSNNTHWHRPILGHNAILCKTCSVLCVLEQPRVDNSGSAGGPGGSMS